MSKKGNTRSRRRSLRIWGGYLLVLMAWVVAVMALAFLGFIICASITWQPSPLYDFLNWVRDYIVLVCIVTVLAGWVVISFYFISKPIKQLDVVANAAEQLSRPSEEPIQLPDSLEDISIQLNLAREQALRDARAAREAEQRKNDLIVYLAHDLKTPLTSVIGYLTLLRDEPQISPEIRARYTGIALEKAERLEDGTWQQAADCIPCTPLVEREAHALLLLDGSGRRLLFDAVFPVLHGKNGEDGTVQGLFELAGVPVIGCGTLSSALCMDKDRAHQLAALAGIRVPRSHVFHSSDDFSRIAQAAEELGYPVFVKPVRAGSSFGITKVSGPEELPAAMEEAFCHDSAVILEETIPGFEVGCAVMGNEELTVGLVDEIALSEGFFNYEEKYTLKTSAIHCPARIPPEKAAEIQAAAKTIYRALDCRVFARVDLFLTPDGEIVFNEVTTIPGFTAHRRYPSMMQGIGISFGELVTRLIELGVVG